MGLTLTDAKRSILSLLEDEPSHGYAIAKELGKQGPTIYEHLQELESAGYIQGQQSDRRKTYTLTQKGELILEAEHTED